MANLTNSAKLIEEMSKKAYKTELPTVNNATVTVAVNGNTGTNSFTTNQASNSTLKITVGKSDIGLGNVDNTSDANKPISTATQAALDLKADKSEISSVYKYKGSKANYDALPSSGNVTGDVWNVEAAHTTAPIFPAGSNLAWDGSAWDVLGGTVDLSNYAQKSEVLTKTNTTAFTPSGDYQPATKKYVDEAYKSGKGISIGQATKNGRQGPAPDGFHVPSTTEWQGVKTIMDGLSLTTGDGWKTNLHMPFSGYRNNSEASINEQNSVGYYWSSTPGAVGSNKAKVTAIATSIIRVGDNYLCANAYSIRCFKDLYVEPTSSWTIIRGTLGSAGIFWDQVNGLISITSNGTTGYTIQDKNLGATTVYNSGDTLSEANCGKYYQWGNNYGFPRTGTVTTSSTQVNASNYGPGNYYSSDTFIIGNNNWDNSNNTDLWGDTTSTYTVDNAISNTGVLSVNGQTGDVTIVSPDMSNYLAKNNTTAFTPTGDYQPATKKYVDDHAGTEYNAGEGISIGNASMNARKGPSPDGFHVPSTNEWQGVNTIMTSLSLTAGDNWRINLHIPYAGSRNNSSASLSNQGSRGCYWSSSPYGSGLPSGAYYLRLDSFGVAANNYTIRAFGFSVRCFKDSYVTPDSTWTVIQGTLGNAGIFWNQSEGLISITDGSTGYTMMDKNLGATTVYNDGDTLTQDNMGNMYQWGNNYGFPSTGTISNTSSTQVDASAYGPTNPYSSDTFITGNEDWSSVHNDNLWGDTTGGTVTIENVISNTGVLSVNGQTGDVTVSSGAEIVYATQAEYDALPSSKLTDGKNYFIYE